MDEQKDKPYIGVPCREQYWKELSIEDKIERMRQQVKLTQYQETDTRGTVMRLGENFSRHKHIDGEISISLDVANGRTQQEVSRRRISVNPDEVYF